MVAPELLLLLLLLLVGIHGNWRRKQVVSRRGSAGSICGRGGALGQVGCGGRGGVLRAGRRAGRRLQGAEIIVKVLFCDQRHGLLLLLVLMMVVLLLADC